MKKIFYLFLAHVIVLGSLWLWRDFKEQESPAVLEEKQNAVSLVFIESDSSVSKFLFCLDKQELAEILPGQIFNISMSSGWDDREMKLSDYSEKGSNACYHIYLNESDPECVVLTPEKREDN